RRCAWSRREETLRLRQIVRAPKCEKWSEEVYSTVHASAPPEPPPPPAGGAARSGHLTAPPRGAEATPDRPAAKRSSAPRSISGCWTGGAGWGREAPQGGPGGTASGRAAGKGGGQRCTRDGKRSAVCNTPPLHARRPRGHARWRELKRPNCTLL